MNWNLLIACVTLVLAAVICATYYYFVAKAERDHDLARRRANWEEDAAYVAFLAISKGYNATLNSEGLTISCDPYSTETSAERENVRILFLKSGLATNSGSCRSVADKLMPLEKWLEIYYAWDGGEEDDLAGLKAETSKVNA